MQGLAERVRGDREPLKQFDRNGSMIQANDYD